MITKLFNKFIFLRDKCEEVDEVLNLFIKKATDNQWDWYIWWNAIQWFIDAISIINPKLWEELSWYVYEFPMFNKEEKLKWIDIEVDWKKYVIHNDDDFLKYLVDLYQK